MADYLRFAKSYYGEVDSEFQRIKLVMKTLRAVYGSTLAREFGPLQFKATRETLASENGKGRTKPRMRQYINSAMKRLARMFKWAASEGKLPGSIYENLRTVPGLKEGRCEAQRSCQFLSGDRIDDSVVTAFFAAIQPANIDTLQATTQQQAAEREQRLKLFRQEVERLNYAASSPSLMTNVAFSRATSVASPASFTLRRTSSKSLYAAGASSFGYLRQFVKISAASNDASTVD